jgi:cytidylate kinase
MANLVITIDGPAASGKSTVARLLADKLGARFLDTGAMYRAVTLAALEAGADMINDTKLLSILDDSDFKFDTKQGKTKVSINGIDVTDKLRSPEVTANAHYVASKPKLRDKLVQMQRKLAEAQERIVTEGRDQGTVAFPDADIKFYLTAEPKERARRRQAELKAKGNEQVFERVQTDIEERDRSDESRAVGPLKPADDAIVVDTTKLSIEQVVQKLLSCVERCS